MYAISLNLVLLLSNIYIKLFTNINQFRVFLVQMRLGNLNHRPLGLQHMLLSVELSSS